MGQSSSSPDTPRTKVVRQILRGLKLYYKVASARLHFARSTRTISAEGCAGTGQIALSPAFRALDARDLRRGLRAHGTNHTLACVCTLDTHDLRRGLRRKSPKRAFRTRLPQNSHVKVCKTSVSCETSSKSQAETPIGAHTHTHHAALPSSFAIPAPPNNIRSHANPNATATFTSTKTHNLTIPCACHENRTSTPQSPREVLRLPRKVTISSRVSFNQICTTPHVWNDFDPFRAHSHPPKSPFQLRLVTKTGLRRHTLKRKSQWHGHIQHPKNTTLQTLIPMELRSNLRISQNAAPVRRSASRFLRDMSVSCKSQWNSGAN